ncbi:MAG TPA: hypothetical protein VHL98_12605 [Microvirga sp.]|nr:hypothetical protein [Microvirga sp.]
MKRLALTLLLVQAATAATAQSGPSTQALTCAQARGIVAVQGAVVLHTGPTTYDRFVRDSSFCPHPLTAQTAFARTADAAQCPVGGVCRDTTIENGQ